MSKPLSDNEKLARLRAKMTRLREQVKDLDPKKTMANKVADQVGDPPVYEDERFDYIIEQEAEAKEKAKIQKER